MSPQEMRAASVPCWYRALRTACEVAWSPGGEHELSSIQSTVLSIHPCSQRYCPANEELSSTKSHALEGQSRRRRRRRSSR